MSAKAVDLHRGAASTRARAVAVAANKRLAARKLDAYACAIAEEIRADPGASLMLDGKVLGAIAKAAWALGARRETLDELRRTGTVKPGVQRLVCNPGLRDRSADGRAQLARAAQRMRTMEAQRKRRAAERAKEKREHGSTSRTRAVNAFLARVGTTEHPAGSNGGGIVSVMQSYWGFGRVPWCGIAAGYHAEKYGGVDLRSDVASVAAIVNHAKSRHAPYGCFETDPRRAQPGALVIIGGYNVHVGMLVAPLRDGSAKTVEGNCLAVDEPVLTPDGWTPIGALHVGQTISDPDGGTAAVRGVFHKGEQDVYEVETADGATVRATSDHLWTVEVGKGTCRRERTITTAEIAALRNRGVTIRLPQIAPQEFPEVRQPLDPYLMGVLIGDGSLGASSPMITSDDAEVRDACREVVPVGVVAHDTVDGRHGTRGLRFSAGGRGGDVASRPPNTVTDALIDTGLIGLRSHEKFVPDAYKWSSVEQRLAVLQGVMDADGSIDGEGRAEFCSTSRRLAEDVQFIIRSLGGKARLCEKGSISYTSPAQSDPKAARDAYVLRNIRLPGLSLFRMSRKAERQRDERWSRRWSITSVRAAGRAMVACIETSAPSCLYLTRGLIPTHNTSFGPGGSQSNGGCIAARVRSPREIYGVATMSYRD